LRRPVDLNVFAAFELLFGRGADGFLNRFDYQIAIDALLLAKGFDVLGNARAHVYFSRRTVYQRSRASIYFALSNPDQSLRALVLSGIPLRRQLPDLLSRCRQKESKGDRLSDLRREHSDFQPQ